MPPSTCKVTDLRFLMLIINNMEGSAINFQKVADGAGMPTAGAASTKYWRIKKAHTLPSDGNTGTVSPAGKATPTTAGKAKRAGKTTTPTKKRKLDEDDQEPEGVGKLEADSDAETIVS
ncbi:hypothetical protein LTR08_004385 [Meristemomyces frigidus]|nr:hypothetical protein LTR08_004385 [Meristemomyces frigidus]